MFSTSFVIAASVSSFIVGFLLLISIYCLWPSHIDAFFGKFILHKQRTAEKPIVGYWYSVFYRRTRQGSLSRHAHIVHISRVQNYYHAIVVKGDFHHFRMSGVLFQKRFVTGLWHNDDRKRAYQGSFQLRLHNNGEFFTGKWLGWNQDDTINAGLWAMAKLTSGELGHLGIDPKKQAFRQKNAADDMVIHRKLEKAILGELEKDRSINWNEV